VRTQPLFNARPVQRLYADDASKRPGQSNDSSSQQAPSTQTGKDGSVEGSTQALGQNANASFANTIDDATLEQIFYGGRTVSSEGDAGLTSAQQEVLYRDGTILPADEAEAMVESTGSRSDVVEMDNQVENPGHKFGLPVKPYPEGFHMKKRYHPVLEQITRLMMKDGKLSVAQRVSGP
jgi:small subunit ribosomal protein S7